MSRKIEFQNYSRIIDFGLAEDKADSQGLVVDSSSVEVPLTPHGKVP